MAILHEKIRKMLKMPIHWFVWSGVILFSSYAILLLLLTYLYNTLAIEQNINDIIADNNATTLFLYQKKMTARNGVNTGNLLPTAPLPKIDTARMKRQGCVTDGLLSGYGDEEKNVELINRLPCYYLHRAVETWLEAPNWYKINRIRSYIVRKPILYGMFIAEAVNTKEHYINTQTGKRFRFKKMCKPGTNGRWGKNTCVPDFDRREYRAYITQIMKEAIDNDIQVFLIGQVQIQDARRVEQSDIEDVLAAVRKYAAQKGVDIAIGAQTNDATDKDYLRLFDFIEGGVGLHPDGSIEDGPCFSRYLREHNWCWALLWHEKYTKKARNVFVHLDWSGMHDDDMMTFVSMDRDMRAYVLKKLYTFYTRQDIGFLLPVFTALPHEHDGCYGNRKRYYSADNAYSCKDEDVIKSILTNYK